MNPYKNSKDDAEIIWLMTLLCAGAIIVVAIVKIVSLTFGNRV